MVGQSDIRNDKRCGFEIIKARDIDRIGVHGVIGKIKGRVAGTKVYISVDIDVLDPAFAPGTCLASDDYVSPTRWCVILKMVCLSTQRTFLQEQERPRSAGGQPVNF